MEVNLSRIDNPNIKRNVFMRLCTRIYSLERENFKTQKKHPNEMVEVIRKVIEFEVNKIDN